jgi:ATP-dependent RNA helicase RhlE
MPMPLPEDFQREASRLPLPSRKPEEQAQDARRDARDAKGRGGQRSGGGQGRNSNVSRGGQGRDGLSRDASARAERIANPHGERGPVSNPLGAAAPRRDAVPAPRRDAVTAVRRDGAPAPRRDGGDARPAAGGDRRPAGRGFGGERGRAPRG